MLLPVFPTFYRIIPYCYMLSIVDASISSDFCFLSKLVPPSLEGSYSV